MKSVIERLDDIENTARSIVAKAEEDKSQVEQEIQAQMCIRDRNCRM